MECDGKISWIEALGGELRLAAAITLHELGATFLGCCDGTRWHSRALFLDKLANDGVDTFGMNQEELRQEMSRA